MIVLCRPSEQVRYVLPISNPDFRQGTALATLALDPVVAVAMLSEIARIAGTQARARAGAEFPFGEFALYGDTSLSSLNHHVNASPPRLSQPVYVVLELKRESTTVFEESRPATLGGHSSQQIESVESPDRTEHALPKGLGTLQATKPPVPLAFRDDRPDVLRFLSIRRNKESFRCVPLRE